jgi:predicted chitinase
MVNLPRIHYARNVVLNKLLPDFAVGDLENTGQVRDASIFIARKLLPVAAAVNENSLENLSLILLECCFYGVNDKSHVAYILASAHHESGMGKQMTEGADGRAYEGRVDLCNNQPGDGPRYKGRGFVQITGRCNYTFYKEFLLTRGLNFDLVNAPQRATEREIAAIILVHGMRSGRFTGSRLAQFGSDCNFDFVNARRVVNGLDRAARIAAIARRYRTSLN